MQLQSQLQLTSKQLEAKKLAQSPARFILYRGGSRSGKSFAICYFVLLRALVAPGSRHGIFRHTAVDVRRTLFDLTFKDVMNKAYPGLWDRLKEDRKINDTEMTIELPNGSIIMFDGLDDSTRQDRILGNEYSTVFVNEVTQFRNFDVIQKLISRLSQELPITNTDRLMSPKLFLDCNPKGDNHWTFKAFSPYDRQRNPRQLENPISGEPWPRQEEWASIQMNPVDNTENISSTYLADLENLSAKDRKRFLDGEWQAENDNAMFNSSWWNGDGRYRRLSPISPKDAEDFVKIIVSVDPAGSSQPGADETGIIVAALDEDGHCYILEDCSGRYQPHEWGAKAIDAYERWSADYIVTEDNYGKELVPNVIRMLNRSVPVQSVWAQRGKQLRAQPVATLYEQGRVHHRGIFEKLEGQMEDFHEGWNRTKDGSPDRLDALVWAITELGVLDPPKRGGKAAVGEGFWR